MLKRVSIETVDQLPADVQPMAKAVVELANRLAAVCDESLPIGGPDLVLNALMNTYLNAAIGFGCAGQAVFSLQSAAAGLAQFEATFPSAPQGQTKH